MLIPQRCVVIKPLNEYVSKKCLQYSYCTFTFNVPIARYAKLESFNLSVSKSKLL